MNEPRPFQALGSTGPSNRRHLSTGAELGLAFCAVVPVLVVLAALEQVSRQHVLYASIASSALAIYVDPLHRSNAPRTILESQALATVAGLGTFLAIGHSYLAAGSALVLTVLGGVVRKRLHPPAVATALAFAFRSGEIGSLAIFAMAVGITAGLVVLERSMLWALGRLDREGGIG